MSDQIISRDEAIDRMKAGLPCETLFFAWQGPAGWHPTRWSHFDADPVPQFRKPPESRREAREWWIGNTSGKAFTWQVNDTIHVREVLPGDVILQRMTEGQARSDWREWREAHPENNSVAEVWVASRRTIGLVKEEGT